MDVGLTGITDLAPRARANLDSNSNLNLIGGKQSGNGFHSMDAAASLMALLTGQGGTFEEHQLRHHHQLHVSLNFRGVWWCLVSCGVVH